MLISELVLKKGVIDNFTPLGLKRRIWRTQHKPKNNICKPGGTNSYTVDTSVIIRLCLYNVLRMNQNTARPSTTATLVVVVDGEGLARGN